MNSRRLSVFIGLGATLVLALALLAPVAGAMMTQPATGMMGGGSTATGDGMMGGGDSGTWCAGGIWDGSGSTWGGTGMWGTGFGGRWLRDHPAAFSAWLKLRTEHMTELRAWFDQYRGSLGSDAARQALQALWQDHWNDMKAFYQQYANGTTWVCPALTMWGGMGGGMVGGWTMWGTGYGTGWLVKHPAAFAAWQTLRARQVSHVRSWWMKYRSAPYGTAAQNALKAMRARHKAQDLTYMSDHHVTSGTAWSYRGWMGLGGTWGGFGW